MITLAARSREWIAFTRVHGPHEDANLYLSLVPANVTREPGWDLVSPVVAARSGVFGNPHDLIAEAVVWAPTEVEQSGRSLDVVVNVYNGQVEPFLPAVMARVGDGTCR